MITFFIKTFGCKVNQSETEEIVRALCEIGLERVERDVPADICIINSCAVTGESERKARQALRRIARKCPGAFVVLTGCGANTITDAPADLIIRQEDKSKVAEIIQGRKGGSNLSLRAKRGNPMGDRHGLVGLAMTDSSALQPSTFSSRTRAFIKIQDGCDNRCSYCIVSVIRSELWSKPPAEVVEEIKRFVVQGGKEVVLTGINLGKYGIDEGGRARPASGLISLIQKILTETELPRIHLSSIEPEDVSDELIELISDETRINPHLHIPLQSGDDEILEAMGRRYSARDYMHKVLKIKKYLPEASITTDMIVGFPGEDEGAFNNSYDLAGEIGFAKIHVFPFSPRPGTEAAVRNILKSEVKSQKSEVRSQKSEVSLDDLNDESICHCEEARKRKDVGDGSTVPKLAETEKKRRCKELITLSDELRNEFLQSQLGKPAQVLVEQKRGKHFTGLSRNYVCYYFEGGDELLGEIVTVRGSGHYRDGIEGQRMSDSETHP